MPWRFAFEDGIEHAEETAASYGGNWVTAV
jgi:hypothetical protein